MKRFGNIRYPDSLLEIVRDKEMVSALYKFAKKRVCAEGILFLLSPQNSPEEIEVLYPKFISTAAPEELNITSALRKKAQALGDAQLWADPGWDAIIQQIRSEVDRVFTNDHLEVFWKSPEFREYHRTKGGSDVDREVTPVMEAAEALQLKNHELLDAYVRTYRARGENATLTLATKLLLSERKRMNVTDFNRFLVGRGLIDAPKPVQNARPNPVTDEDVPPPPPRLAIDVRKLKQCGFDNVGGVVFQDRCYAMIECYLNKDRQKAIAIYEKILKEEPKNSPLQIVPLIDLMKIFKEKKVYRDLAKQA